MFLWFFLPKPQTNDEKNNFEFTRAFVGNKEIYLEIADEERERVMGLSGRKNLKENTGLLFVFEKKDFYGIWMKDMNFPIDIIWLDEDFKVVGIKENARPESYPEVFRPSGPALYVLEANAGLVKETELKEGSIVEIK